MTTAAIKTALPLAAGAYLGVRAAELAGQTGFVGVLVAIAGATAGLLIAQSIAK